MSLNYFHIVLDAVAASGTDGACDAAIVPLCRFVYNFTKNVVMFCVYRGAFRDLGERFILKTCAKNLVGVVVDANAGPHGRFCLL